MIFRELLKKLEDIGVKSVRLNGGKDHYSLKVWEENIKAFNLIDSIAEPTEFTICFFEKL